MGLKREGSSKKHPWQWSTLVHSYSKIVVNELNAGSISFAHEAARRFAISSGRPVALDPCSVETHCAELSEAQTQSPKFKLMRRSCAFKAVAGSFTSNCKHLLEALLPIMTHDITPSQAKFPASSAHSTSCVGDGICMREIMGSWQYRSSEVCRLASYTGVSVNLCLMV